MKNERTKEDLRGRLVSGEFAPGSRLTLRDELVLEYGVSKGTMQRVINELVSDGFLHARGSKGMFVVNNPPHLCRFGVALPAMRANRPGFWDTFWSALLEEALRFQQRGGGESFVFYEGVVQSGGAGQWEQLLADIRACRLAGLLLLEHTHLPTERLAALRDARVAILSHLEYEEEWLRSLWFDYAGLIGLGLSRLVECGGRRVALLTNLELPAENVGCFLDRAREVGVQARQEWVQGVPLNGESDQWAHRLVRLLFSRNNRELPDSLLILNENLAAPARRAISECGLTVGKDVRIVCHCNRLPADVAGMDWLGFDLEALIGQFTGLLRQWPPKQPHLAGCIPAVWRRLTPLC